MDTWVWILLLVAVVVVVVGALFVQQQKTRRLQANFGSEYDRSVHQLGDRRNAEAELERRRERVAHLDIRPLSREDQTRFADAWRSIQAHFVDDPTDAIAGADRLVTEVMRVRGYPVTDFEQRAADVSVDHPQVVENYRAAYAIARHSERDEATTEDLRQAVVHYRALFQDLLETEPLTEKERSHDRTPHQVA